MPFLAIIKTAWATYKLFAIGGIIVAIFACGASLRSHLVNEGVKREHQRQVEASAEVGRRLHQANAAAGAKVGASDTAVQYQVKEILMPTVTVEHTATITVRGSIPEYTAQELAAINAVNYRGSK